jgi:hypothetical protein
MKKITLDQIRSFNPCYDPAKYLPENWEGTVLDILNVTDCPAEDRLWVVLRKEFFTDKQLRLFAVWCARQALAIPGNESEVCSNTCDVAERYANGNATSEELAAARAAASDAARAAAGGAAWGAAWAAASDVARAAASDAARAAAGGAAWGAARAAAWGAARAAAGGAAWGAAWAAQIEHLKIMLNEI